MKVPANWLREYVEIELPLEELARQLVFTSCEVDRIVRRGVPAIDGNFEHFVVGRVLEAGKHPNADKLQLTKVDVGEGEPRQIVCGAWNFGAGATVAVVLPGAVMPGDFAIEKRKLRGEVSDGMILSERRARDRPRIHGGIMLLDGALAPGTPLADVRPPRRRRARDRDGLQPARPDLDLRHRTRGRRADGRRARTDARPGSGAGGRPGGRHPDRGSRALPGLPRPAVRRRPGGRLAALAEGAAAAGRDAADLERGRRHQLRDARARQPDARVRLRDSSPRAASSFVTRGPASSSSPSTAAGASSTPRIS